MIERVECHRCGKTIISAVEIRALNKIKASNPRRFEKLRSARCSCISMENVPAFTSRPHPPDLQWYDKFSR